MKVLCALAFFLAASNSAHAESYSGADLKRFADAGEAVKEGQSGVDQIGAGVYIGYLAGVAGSFQGIYYCPPTGVTLRDEAAVVAKYLKDNPDKLEQPTQLLVVKALEVAYPCSSAFSPADLNKQK